MANYDLIEPDENVKGRKIWTATILASEEHEGFPTLYVLAEEEFRFFQFADEADQAEAVDRFTDGSEPDEVDCKDEITIPIDNITRVERLPGKDWFYVQAEDEGKTRWSCIYCPDKLAGSIFKALRKRLRPQFTLCQERQGIRGALGQPLGFLLVVWFLTMLVWLGAKSAERPRDNNAPAAVTKGAKAVDGARRLGGLIGTTGTLVIGGVLSIGVLGYGLVKISQRPMKKVFRPRLAGERADKDREDAADEEEVEELVARPRSSNRATRGQEGKAAKRAGSKKARTLGIVALVLGILAIALGWLAPLQIVMLLVALAGFGVGIGGFMAARARHGRGQAMPIAGSAASLLGVVVVVIAMFTHSNEGKDVAANTAPPEPPAKGPQPPNKPVTPITPDPKPSGVPSTTMADWGVPSDPDRDCTIEVRGSSLEIDVPGTPHGLVEGVGQGNAPRVMRELTGDFTIQVRVCGTLHPTADRSAPQALSFQAGGLLLWYDKNSYARFVRSGQNREGSFQPVVAWSIPSNGKQGIKPQTVAVPEQDVYLRLERRGRQLNASYSLDGRQWMSLQGFQGTIAERVSVGVVALNAAKQPMSVRFEDLRVAK